MRSEVNDTTQLPPPLAVAHGEERERGGVGRERREGGVAWRERERRDMAKREKEERGGVGRERESRRLGLPISGNSLQGFASKLSDGRLRGGGFVFIGETRKP